MQYDNICTFVPLQSTHYLLYTAHFVLQSNSKKTPELKIGAFNKMYLVTEGEGILHSIGRQTPISRGDLFFTFSAVPFDITAESENLKYMYISFLGERGNMIMENMGINTKKFLFSGFEHLEELWNKCINSNEASSVYKSESALLYAFGALEESLLCHKESAPKTVGTSRIIKKYIDDNYTNPELSLELLSEELKYNPKYISTVFKKENGIGVSRYINTIRIQHACTLMRQGFESISDIAYQSGFSDPQYFSYLFKERMEVSPKKYIALNKK